MRFLDRYRRFDALSGEEVSERLRAEAGERRSRALQRVDPLDLRRTTWPELPPPAVVNAITFAARRSLHRYAEPRAADLRSALAHRHAVRPEHLVVGAGAAQLLRDAFAELVGPGDEVVVPWPSYSLYPLLARRTGGHAVPVRGFSAAAVLSAVNERTRLVALCNPNDPTGELLRAGELRELLETLPERVVVVLDEALRDFVDAEEPDAALSLVARHPRMLVVRTFSKAWGLAGLRCGYAVGGEGSEPLLERLAPELGPNELAVAGALEALRSAAVNVAERVGAVAAERDRLAAALRELPVTALPSQANVVWLAAPGLDGVELARRLERHAVLVAPGGPLGDSGHVRAALSRPAATDRLVEALARALQPVRG
ncbi:MAG TPA: aminotransferase class I/II-fold pyridoxal phosphate-dependent enzyme [Solirubrobacteraceae bacterium]|nr:aminotransferase class I/II-fold pyridoxal phosphate-dependent enzyme [Solirubrobacteraceae bacterium]